MPDAEFSLKTSQFEGPLDLLLSLVQERKLYINEVSLSEVTDAYLAYVQGLKELPVSETSQFVLVATTLLVIKSRSLLPTLELTEEEEQSIEELERRLAQYKLIKQAAQHLRGAWGTAPLAFPKKRPVRDLGFAPGEVSTTLLQQTAAKLVAALPAESLNVEARVGAVVSLEEMIEDLQERVLRAVKTSFNTLTSASGREEVIVHFLALLELVKGGRVAATQGAYFDDIVIESDQLNTPQYGN